MGTISDTSKEKTKLSPEEKYYRTVVIQRIAKILGYPPGVRMPSYVFKLLKDIEGYGYEVINLTITECIPDFQWADENKSFPTTKDRMAYMMAIIRNHCLDVYNEFHGEQEKVYKVDEPIDMEDVDKQEQGVVDITRFLNDGD